MHNVDTKKVNEKWLQEVPKQILSKEQREKYFEQQTAALIKQQEEDMRQDALGRIRSNDADKESKPKRIQYDLGSIGYELGDEDPITKVTGFNIPDSALRFQQCQFDPRIKRSSSGKTVKWDDRYAVGPMPSPSSWGTIPHHGVKTGLTIMDEYFNFIGQPRKAVEESAWIFDDLRFRDFIIRQVEQADVDWYGANPKAELDDIAWRFGRPLKTYFGLYYFFRAGMTDKEISDAEGSTIPAGLWRKGTDRTDIAARTKDRARMMAAGFDLYGCGPVGKNLNRDTVERADYFWPFFEEIRKEVARCQESDNAVGSEENN
jgi:hypothetical protein